MPGLVHFLRCLGRSAVKNGARALASLVPFGEVSYEIARDAFETYRRELSESQLRLELQELAQASPADARQAAEEVAAVEAADQPDEIRLALVSYLDQVPATVRQSLRRPADPHGTTVPAARPLSGPEDLLPFLPAGLPRFRPGDRPLAADWELVELLGKGGFGEVWKARHLTRSSQKPVALKFCLDAAAAHSLRNEAALHDLLDRVREQGGAEGIVPLLETYLRADPPCLMYEYVEGGDLTGFVQEMNAQGKLTPDLSARVVHRLAVILANAHRLSPPLVHRDLKPSNVLVRRAEGDLPNLFVTDLGIGELAAGQTSQHQTSRLGTPSRTLPTAVRGAYTPLYASPQQVRGEKPDPRDDVHALGVIWYQLLTGDLKLLAIPPDWRDVVAERNLAEELTAVLASCLSSRAEKRPANAGELAERIAKATPPAKTIVSREAVGSVISPRRTYLLRHLLSEGDAADVYLAQGDPAVNPTESSYVLKVSRTPEGRRLLDNERKVLAYLLTRAGDSTYRKYLPTLAESFPADDGERRVNVFLHEPGFYTLEQVHEQHPALDGRHLAWIFKRLLTVLGFCHAEGTLHGAVLPCHVMIHAAGHGVQLVGWGQSVEAGEPIAALPRYRGWYPPEVNKKQPATAATDLFGAARCLVYLAGGGPAASRMPDAVPAAMRRFVETCLLEGVRMRPDNAWKLHDEFDDLLRQLYGPPRFHELKMN